MVLTPEGLFNLIIKTTNYLFIKSYQNTVFISVSQFYGDVNRDEKLLNWVWYVYKKGNKGDHKGNAWFMPNSALKGMKKCSKRALMVNKKRIIYKGD